MSADRPLSTRYGELVFPDSVGSPTVAQALVLNYVLCAEIVPPDLKQAFIDSLPGLKRTGNKLVETHNQREYLERQEGKAEIFKRLGKISANVDHTDVFNEAVRAVGIEWINELPTV